MTKRKPAKRKRAPGGGRKPQGEFSGLSVPFSVRMPATMRAELKKAAKKSGRKDGQELLRRLQGSFNRERQKSRDTAMQALCFLFSELAESVHLNIPDWRSDRWLFLAVKSAIGKLLDAFEPTGEIEPPKFWKLFRQGNLPGFDFTKEQREQITQSPEAMAGYVVRNLLLEFEKPKPRHKDWEHWQEDAEAKKVDPSERQMIGQLINDWENSYYGMVDARRDLSMKQKPHGRK
jgi:hypothetical protein